MKTKDEGDDKAAKEKRTWRSSQREDGNRTKTKPAETQWSELYSPAEANNKQTNVGRATNMTW